MKTAHSSGRQDMNEHMNERMKGRRAWSRMHAKKRLRCGHRCGGMVWAWDSTTAPEFVHGEYNSRRSPSCKHGPRAPPYGRALRGSTNDSSVRFTCISGPITSRLGQAARGSITLGNEWQETRQPTHSISNHRRQALIHAMCFSGTKFKLSTAYNPHK